MAAGTTLMRRVAAGSVTLALLAACESTGTASPEVIAGDSRTVSLATGKFIDPTDKAESHCAGYGRQAVYVSRGVLSKSGMMDIYIFNCVEPGEAASEPAVADEVEEVQ